MHRLRGKKLLYLHSTLIWTVIRGVKGEGERTAFASNLTRTTPRHSSLAEIKTATTRNPSRLAGQWNRATVDNVSHRQSYETHPAARPPCRVATIRAAASPDGAPRSLAARCASCRCVAVAYETTIEASMGKRLPARGDFIGCKLQPTRRNRRYVNRPATVMLTKSIPANRSVTVAFLLRSCRSHGPSGRCGRCDGAQRDTPRPVSPLCPLCVAN